MGKERVSLCGGTFNLKNLWSGPKLEYVVFVTIQWIFSVIIFSTYKNENYVIRRIFHCENLAISCWTKKKLHKKGINL